jgi:hypothetical protein
VGGGRNIIDRSTVTCDGQVAVLLDGTSYSEVRNSYLRAVELVAVLIKNSPNSILSSNLMESGCDAIDGVITYTGGADTNISSNTIIGLLGISSYDNADGTRRITLSSNTIIGASYGLLFMNDGLSLNISSMTFRDLTPGATAIYLAYDTPANIVSTFSYVNFASTNIAVNVNGSGMSSGSRITMRGAMGVRTGPSYEKDINSYVDWIMASPGTPSALMVGVSSITWEWTTDGNALGYKVYRASAPATEIASLPLPEFEHTGLSTNTAYGLIVKGIGNGVEDALSPSATVYTLAAPPSGLVVSGVYVSSAAINWSWNTKPDTTLAQIYRSTDNLTFPTMVSSVTVSYVATGLDFCTTYYFKVRNLNGDGVPTGYSGPLELRTNDFTPEPPSGLSAEAVAGNRIALFWEFSPSASVTQYKLYYDNATGTINYDTPYEVFSSTVSGWTTGALVAGNTYKFGLRSVNRCDTEETNTSVFASAQAVNSLTGVKAAIRVPQSGKKVKGNRVTIIAELISGQISQTKQILFQYRPVGGGAWTNIVAANTNHPNPDFTAPYLVHWNVDADLSVGAATVYELRAVATDIYNVADPAPPSITIVVVPSAFSDYDINENLVSGVVQKEQKVNNAISNTVQAADEGSALVTKILIPSGALSDSTVTVAVINNPASQPSPPQNSVPIGILTKIDFSNGQSQLAGGQTATVTLNYEDADNDGVVDGTTAEVDKLRMYTASTMAGPWTILSSNLDGSKKTVAGTTTHFSFFGLFAPLATDLKSVEVYPVPFKPNDGNADTGVDYSAGNPNSGIIFANLPSAVSIKIYTVTGQLVAKFSTESSLGELQWDVKNESGKSVASGVYIAVISSWGQKSITRKVMVIR